MGLVKVLLDTCTFLWLALEPGRLSPSAVAAYNDPRTEAYLSEISVWEIVLKHGRGKLKLPEHPRTWIFFNCSPFAWRRRTSTEVMICPVCTRIPSTGCWPRKRWSGVGTSSHRTSPWIYWV